jgi:hypothetical protein
MTYALDHASAYADILAAGAAITFTKAVPGTMTPGSGVFSGASSSAVAGVAIRDKGDPKRYEALKLTQTEAVTLLFAPSTYGQMPELNAVGVFAGVTYRVRDVEPVAPDGNVIIASIVVTR